MNSVPSIKARLTNYLDGRTLKNALTETFNNRNTSLDTISAFDDGFADNYYRQQRWKGFLKSKNVMLQIPSAKLLPQLRLSYSL